MTVDPDMSPAGAAGSSRAPAGDRIATPGAIATALEAARQTLLLLRYRRAGWYLLVTLLALGALSYVLAGRVHERLDGRTLYCLLAWWVLGGVVVPWSTLYLGVQAIHGEIEDRTAQYLFLRPIARVPLLLGKWLAVFAVSSAIAVGGALLVFAGVASRGHLWPDGVEWGLLRTYCVVLSLGGAAYAAVAMFFGATFRRPLAWAAFFVVGVQMLAANAWCSTRSSRRRGWPRSCGRPNASSSRKRSAIRSATCSCS